MTKELNCHAILNWADLLLYFIIVIVVLFNFVHVSSSELLSTRDTAGMPNLML